MAGERNRTQAVKLGTLTPQQEETIDAITRGITNKFLHRMITELRGRPESKSAEGE